MRYTVKDFLASGKFSDIKLLNNSGDTDREITGIRIIEVPDIEKYLTSSVENSTLRSYHSIKNR